MAFATPESQHSNQKDRITEDDEARLEEEEARLFYESLEQTGQLVDVDANTDLQGLPPRVTHIRHPDGTVERIRFSASP